MLRSILAFITLALLSFAAPDPTAYSAAVEL
jgi:hypothetical protein